MGEAEERGQLFEAAEQLGQISFELVSNGRSLGATCVLCARTIGRLPLGEMVCGKVPNPQREGETVLHELKRRPSPGFLHPTPPRHPSSAYF